MTIRVVLGIEESELLGIRAFRLRLLPKIAIVWTAFDSILEAGFCWLLEMSIPM
jgi:hypothetical protein